MGDVGTARLRSLVRDVRRLADDMMPLLLFLHGDVRESTRRAVPERGRSWVDYWSRVAEEDHAVGGPALERIVHHQERSQAQKQADLDILRSTGWFLLDLDATAPAEDVLAQALAGLGLWRPA
ncbi:hypothetical protein SAMN04489717_1614 [Actinopolymorpha singaporensis]|uniref:Uncharacterized protein n=1 Tax=Actinopolymorpha singaporensis TaxID=117157 RepID=A0A1H1PFA9_9ACTN|nr:hypothetical protein SAMN04489717_1614 [Actinopolymorpha singaporensis]